MVLASSGIDTIIGKFWCVYIMVNFLFSFLTHQKYHDVIRKYADQIIKTKKGYKETASAILAKHGIHDICIKEGDSDGYDPVKQNLYINIKNYNESSLSLIAMTAYTCGCAILYHEKRVLAYINDILHRIEFLFDILCLLFIIFVHTDENYILYILACDMAVSLCARIMKLRFEAEKAIIALCGLSDTNTLDREETEASREIFSSMFTICVFSFICIIFGIILIICSNILI